MIISDNVVNIARRSADNLAKTVDPSLQATIEPAIASFHEGSEEVTDAASFLVFSAILAWNAYLKLREEEAHPSYDEVLGDIESDLVYPADLSEDEAEEYLEVVLDMTIEEGESM